MKSIVSTEDVSPIRIAKERPKARNASKEPKKVAYQPSNSLFAH